MADEVSYSGNKLISTRTSESIPSLEIDGDVTIGRIRTPSPFAFPSQPNMNRITFGGIQGEARFVPAAAMGPRSLTELTTNGVHRVVLPDAATTTIYATLEIEEWWLKDHLNVGFEWINETAGTGNVRWTWQIKVIDIFVDTLANGVLAIDRTLTTASQAAGLTATEVIAADFVGFPFDLSTPGILGSFYSVAITRLGSDALDTLAGNVGIVGVSYGRADADL